MQRITGIGGIFFKSAQPELLRAWYQQHLGLDIQPWGGTVFHWQAPGRSEPDGGVTVWSVAEASSSSFEPSAAPFMVNYRVDDLHAMLAQLRAAGCAVGDKVDDSEYGKFGWVMDPDGNRVELWQPPTRPPAA